MSIVHVERKETKTARTVHGRRGRRTGAQPGSQDADLQRRREADSRASRAT